MDNPSIVADETLTSGQSVRTNASKQRWLKAWEESAFKSEEHSLGAVIIGQRAEQGSPEPHELVDLRLLTRSNAPANNPPLQIGNVLDIEAPREGMGPVSAIKEPQQGRRSSQPRELTPLSFFQKAVTFLGRSAGHNVSRILLERMLRSNIPDVNIQVIVAGDNVAVRVRDFRRDAPSLHELLERVRQLTESVGLRLKMLVVNGHEVFSLPRGE